MSVLIKDNKGIISLNNENFLESPKIFISDNNQIRFQANILNKENSRYVDIVIYDFDLEKPSVIDVIRKNANASLNVTGEEIKSKTSFRLMITYRLGKEFPYYFQGIVGKNKISQAFETSTEVFKHFCNMFDLSY